MDKQNIIPENENLKIDNKLNDFELKLEKKIINTDNKKPIKKSFTPITIYINNEEAEFIKKTLNKKPTPVLLYDSDDENK